MSERVYTNDMDPMTPGDEARAHEIVQKWAAQVEALTAKLRAAAAERDALRKRFEDAGKYVSSAWEDAYKELERVLDDHRLAWRDKIERVEAERDELVKFQMDHNMDVLVPLEKYEQMEAAIQHTAALRAGLELCVEWLDDCCPQELVERIKLLATGPPPPPSQKETT